MNKKAMSSPRQHALRACGKFMRPIARYLIRNGVGFREFSEVAKEAFVEVTSNDYGIRGRLTNISRVAVLTGLTRKEVSRLRHKLIEKSQAGEEIDESRGRPELILEKWFHHPDYLDEMGRPLAIPMEGDHRSFERLVRDIGGDIPAGAMAKELIRSGSVVKENSGLLAAVSESFVPEAADPQAVEYAGSAICDLAETINYNLYETDKTGRILERRLLIRTSKRRDMDKFLGMATAEAEGLLEKLSDLTIVDDSAGSEGCEGNRVGIGIYLIKD
jgi:hypothetical protein